MGVTSSSSATSSLSPPPSISETDVSGESGGGTPAFSASRWFLAEISRRCAFLTAFAFLSSLAFLCSSFRARFLARISLSSGTGGRESLMIPFPYEANGKRGLRQEQNGNKRKKSKQK